MTIERLKSGSYRATMMVKGKRYRITYQDKPTKRQAELDLYEMINQTSDAPNNDLTFKQAAKAYIEMKRNVLSPNTVRDYSLIPGRLSEWFVNLKIDEISQIDINKQINELSVTLSPKTVRNYHGFISAILGTYRPQLRIYTTLPQNRKTEPYIPSDKDVKRILKALEGTEYYVGTILSCYGMRRGEILALTLDDIEDDGTVHIRKSMALDSERNKVIKSTKTTHSERDIMIPLDVVELIREQGYVYRRKPGGITQKLGEVQEQLGIPHFSMHKLRHYFASKMLTITDSKTVQALGGWKTDAVLNSVYAHSLKEEQDKARKQAAATLGKAIF